MSAPPSPQRHRRRLRVATKYAQLTRSFFAHAGISDYRIVESAGATEGAPAAGTAEAIVDITTTGATLRDNGLKMLDDGAILKSQAQLAASLTADWDGEARAACETLLAQTRRQGAIRFMRRWRSTAEIRLRQTSPCRGCPDRAICSFFQPIAVWMRVRPEG